ncbi:DUF1242-domain-containing protein [Conidiobolus coronatus NRRL 28638]|uniref:Protein kish n=1 Tax=Conidiobolus coronatus (strain ATCC 28846 / CBS 209.66 / NRRL 28638) TaxID=796925 RepID=A0A137P4E2_CONC2|nr:DUF1242-domain-containing protein [Conidiobolus coronatus NRRL 28638]|eukprot:KXN69863.1 DUF1242-domain-containing protein [Conidiobolus coronatus NRRL 28638]
MSALFNFQSLLLVLVLTICTSTYVKSQLPSFIDKNKGGFQSLVWKMSRIGERLSPYVSLACLFLALNLFLGIFEESK